MARPTASPDANPPSRFGGTARPSRAFIGEFVVAPGFAAALRALTLAGYGLARAAKRSPEAWAPGSVVRGTSASRRRPVVSTMARPTLSAPGLSGAVTSTALPGLQHGAGLQRHGPAPRDPAAAPAAPPPAARVDAAGVGAIGGIFGARPDCRPAPWHPPGREIHIE